MSKIVSQLDESGVFISPVVADESPLEQGVFLIPRNAVDVTPPSIPDGYFAKWNGAEFEILPIPTPPEPVVEPPTPEQIIAQYTDGVQQHLDTFARTRNYDGILSAATYATSQVPKFKAEGQYAVEARDATWAKCYEVLAAVEAGSRPMPTLDELLAELPALVWPQ